eukprot:846163-Amphidinium_carterae.1
MPARIASEGLVSFTLVGISALEGNAKTGSGKTACYCLPTLHYLSQDPFGVFTLVLLPVRELAFQVSENFKAACGLTTVEY